LVEMALSLAADILREGGDLLVKAFQGADLDDLVKQMKRHFAQVQRCKPDASRDRSRELYLLARSYRVRV
jgi:23S rRNA (uridine2552-2'-O)-methyltransferase